MWGWRGWAGEKNGGPALALGLDVREVEISP